MIILERLQAEKRVVVSELSVIYQVSEETIRRDLEKLENDGLVIKSYGGAVLNEHSILIFHLTSGRIRRLSKRKR